MTCQLPVPASEIGVSNYKSCRLFKTYNNLHDDEEWRNVTVSTEKIYLHMFHKIPKHSDTRKICCNPPKVRMKWHYHRVTHPKDAHGMANSVDPDQTAQSDLGLHSLLRPVCPKT